MDANNFCVECEVIKPCDCDKDSEALKIAKRIVEDNIEVYKRLKDR